VQLSLYADYACRVLIYLATTTAERSSVDEIASAFRISQNHLVKIVHRLGKLGFIETTRGRGGGISLAKDPSTIRIGDVIRQTEQPNFAVTECFEMATNTCPIAGVCGLKPWLAAATEAFLSTLEGVTLADVTGNPKRIKKALGHDRSFASGLGQKASR
jgi:Rrf2 family nitric oxide-sensitive transcriptional repressor